AGPRGPSYRRLRGGLVNSCCNARDRHVEHGRADHAALIYGSPVTGTIKTFTYRELRDEVARFAGVLRGQGVRTADRVIIYMPMVPEAVVAMLACARIGAIHSVVFGGFASHELAARISHAEPALIVSASCGIEVNRVVPYKPLLDKAIELASGKPRSCIILQRPEERAPLVGALEDDAGARLPRGELDRLVEQRLVRHDAVHLDAARGGDDQRRLGVADAGRQLMRREAPEHDRMDRADARAREHRDHRFRDHGHIDDHPVGGSDALASQDPGKAGDLVTQLPIREG